MSNSIFHETSSNLCKASSNLHETSSKLLQKKCLPACTPPSPKSHIHWLFLLPVWSSFSELSEMLSPGLYSLSPNKASVGAFQVVLAVKNPLANVGNIRDAGSISGLGRSPEGIMATHSSLPAQRTPWMEEPGGLWSMGPQNRTWLSNWAQSFQL